MVGNPSIFKVYVVKFVEFLGPNITYFENIINESELFSKIGDMLVCKCYVVNFRLNKV